MQTVISWEAVGLSLTQHPSPLSIILHENQRVPTACRPLLDAGRQLLLLQGIQWHRVYALWSKRGQ